MGPQIHDAFSRMLYQDNLKVSHKFGRTLVVVSKKGTLFVLLMLWGLSFPTPQVRCLAFDPSACDWCMATLQTNKYLVHEFRILSDMGHIIFHCIWSCGNP